MRAYCRNSLIKVFSKFVLNLPSAIGLFLKEKKYMFTSCSKIHLLSNMFLKKMWDMIALKKIQLDLVIDFNSLKIP